MRGEKEQQCFEKVRQVAYKKDDKLFLGILEKAEPNPQKNEFPDFIFDGGFIEHFQVSAANETRKGSEHNRTVGEFERQHSEAFEREKEKFLQSPLPVHASADQYIMTVSTHKMISPLYSYKSFTKSFKGNFSKHIQSLKKYTGEKACGIFLIELVGAQITVLHDGIFIGFYRLRYDGAMLKFLYEFRDYLKYVTFVWDGDYEFLELQNVPAVLEQIPQELSFGVGKYKNICLDLFMDT